MKFAQAIKQFALITIFYLCFFTWISSACAQTENKEEQPLLQNHAIILSYHHIGEELYPEQNLSVEQFKNHIAFLQSEGYNILPLPDIIAAFKSGKSLPEASVAITFDGIYRSTYDNAMRVMLDAGMPFTIFIPGDMADPSSKSTRYLSWSEIRTLARNKNVTIGAMPAKPIHLYNTDNNEYLRLINKSVMDIQKRTGKRPQYLSYAFGEYNAALLDNLSNGGFEAGFAMHSAPASTTSNIMALPRYIMTEGFGDISRLDLILNAKPILTTDEEPRESLVRAPTPNIGFTTLSGQNLPLEALQCFASGTQEKPSVNILGDRIEIRLAEDLKPYERTRINCTMQAAGQPQDQHAENNIWNWYGMLIIYAPDESE